MPQAPWLDVRVFYVRVSFCSLEEAPDILTIKYDVKDVSSNLEVNGSRVGASEDVALNLRRDRMDAESSEVIYVGTDRLRTTGSLRFEVCHKEESIIKGTMEKSDVWLDGQGLDRIGTVGAPNSMMASKAFKSGSWVMECRCSISSSRCIFLKRKNDGAGASNSASSSPPLMEVYVTGRYAGSPVILTQTVELVLLRRKLGRWNTLDSIPEVDESERPTSSFECTDLANQVHCKVAMHLIGANCLVRFGFLLSNDLICCTAVMNLVLVFCSFVCFGGLFLVFVF
jgi:hypothetical protein